jgi:hypothetical protein
MQGLPPATRLSLVLAVAVRNLVLRYRSDSVSTDCCGWYAGWKPCIRKSIINNQATYMR